MSIKFPDMQVLVSRTDQIPKPQREGDQQVAGKLAPQVQNEFERRKQRIQDSPKGADLRNDRRENEQSVKGRKRQRRSGDGRGNHLDLRG